MESKWTPGPWAVIKSIDSKTVFPEDSRNTRPIARAVQQGPEQNEANAQAIAALPELVEALEMAIKILQAANCTAAVLNPLEEALAKVEGK